MGDGDERFMRKALELAARGLGRTRPNPAVGAVLAKGDTIIGSGYHHECGTPHAEIQALAACRESPAGSTLYVTLEPCGHHGRTPPCSQAIIDAKIKRVFYGTGDPNPLTSGKGLEQIREAGIKVVQGPLCEECDHFNAPYLKWMQHKLPLVTAKWAMTLDGKIATRSRHSKWITSEEARRFAHTLRNRVDAILVGTQTALVDDPELTCRIPDGNTPLRVALDRSMKLPPTGRLFSTTSKGPVLIYTENRSCAQAEALLKQGVEVQEVAADRYGLDLGAILADLGARSIHHLLVEGGGTLLGRFFDQELVDRVCVFLAPKIAGGTDAVTPVGGLGIETMDKAPRITITKMQQVGADVVFLGDVVKK